MASKAGRDPEVVSSPYLDAILEALPVDDALVAQCMLATRLVAQCMLATRLVAAKPEEATNHSSGSSAKGS